MSRTDSDDPARLAYFEWSADPKAALNDPDALAQANPALGIRLTEEFSYGTERLGMDDEEFARERLGIFDDSDDVVSVIPSHDWKACAVDATGPDPGWMVSPVSLGVDITPDRDWSSIGAVGDCRDGGLALEVVDHRPGTAWIVDRVIELVERHGPKCIVIDPKSAAGTEVTKLEAAGIQQAPHGPLVLASYDDHKQACAGLYDDIVEHAVAHRAQPELDAAVVGASQRPAGDAWLWNRRAGAIITPLVSVTLARWGHLRPSDESPPVDIALNVW